MTAAVEQAGFGSLETQLQGRLNGAFWVLTGGLLTLLVAALVWFSMDQDRRAQAMSQRIASSAVNARLNFLSKTIGDYSIWDDAYANVVEKPNRGWMDGNIGPFVFNSLHFERSFVVDGAGKAVYAMTGGKVLDTARPDGMLPAEISPMIVRSGSAGARPSASLLRLGGKPVMVAICRIAPSTAGRTADPAKVRILVFVDVIDRTVLSEMGRIYLLDGLRLKPPGAQSGAAHIPLADFGGAQVAALEWNQAKPGEAMLKSIAPVIAGLALLVALIGSWLMRNVRRIVEQMLEDRGKAEDAIARARIALAAARAAQGDAAEARRQLEEIEGAHFQLQELRQSDWRGLRMRA